MNAGKLLFTGNFRLLDSSKYSESSGSSESSESSVSMACSRVLSSGTFPQQLKTAIITPLLKKDGLDPVYSNYHSVSNLTFLSKIIEKAAASSFYCHMESEHLLPKYQSAYRSGFSTETLLLKLHNDLLENMEKQYITSLVAIDLSAAFDKTQYC